MDRISAFVHAFKQEFLCNPLERNSQIGGKRLMATQVSNDPQRPVFNNWKRLCFGMGNYGCCFSFSFIGSYLMMFMTDVALIPAAVVGNIMLIARVWDAIIDPPIGAIADKTVTRWGRYRPYVIFAAIPMLIFNTLLFTAFPSWSLNARIAWMVFTYFGLATTYSFTNIPFSAMLASITADPVERGRLSGWRMSGASCAGLIISFSALRMIKWIGQGDQAKGFFWTALFFSCLAVPCFLLCFFNTKEVVVQEVQKSVNLRKMFATLKGNKPMWIQFIVFTIMGFSSGGSSLTIYYFRYYGNNVMIQANNSLISSIAGLCSTIIVTYVVHKFKNKGHITMISQSVSAIGQIIKYFVPIWTPGGEIVYYCITALVGLINGWTLSILYAMAPDINEYTLYHYGIHTAGFTSSFVNLGNQFGAALMVASAAWILAFVGYVPNQDQSQQTLEMIRFASHIYTAICSLLCVAVMAFYKFDNATVAEYREKISRGEFAPGVTLQA